MPVIYSEMPSLESSLRKVRTCGGKLWWCRVDPRVSPLGELCVGVTFVYDNTCFGIFFVFKPHLSLFGNWSPYRHGTSQVAQG